MPFPNEDLTGKRYGQWTAEARDPMPNSTSGAVYWLVVCDCGNEGSVRSTELIDGHSTKCRPCGIKIWKAARHVK